MKIWNRLMNIREKGGEEAAKDLTKDLYACTHYLWKQTIDGEHLGRGKGKKGGDICSSLNIKN